MHDSTRSPGAPAPGQARDARAAFLEVWLRQERRLYRLCLRWMGGHAADAEDAMAKLSIRALEDLEAHAEEVSNYPGWLTRLAWNLCIDAHRERASCRRALERFTVYRWLA